MTKDDARTSVRILSLAQQAGFNIIKAGTHEHKVLCPNPNHKDSSPSCYINDDTNMFYCHGCEEARGDVFHWIQLTEGCDFKTACEKLGVEMEAPVRKKETKYVPPKAPEQHAVKVESKYPKFDPKYLTETYDYKDSTGKLKHRCKRFDYPDGSKGFMQSGITEDGAEVMSMKGIQRVPFRSEHFHESNTLYFVEGEKCVLSMVRHLNLPATCTVGGSKAWTDSYAEYFRDKEMILIPDNDETGRDFMMQVAKACSGIASSVKIMDLFTDKPSKWDIADEIDEHDGVEAFACDITQKALICPPFVKGEELHIYSAQQLQTMHHHKMLRWSGRSLDLSRWIPAMAEYNVRPLIGGDLLVIGAPTGGMKTALAQNIEIEFPEQDILHFSIELEGEKMFERNASIIHEQTGPEIEELSRQGEFVSTERMDHIYTVPLAKVDTKIIDRYTKRADLVMGKKPTMVVIDYLQLVKALSNVGRYERFSDIIEELKLQGKENDVIMLVITQVGRVEDASKLGLHSSKESGSIENSSSMFLLVKPHEQCSDVKLISCEKYSNGQSGWEIPVGVNGEHYKFTPQQVERRILETNLAPEPPDDDEDTPF